MDWQAIIQGLASTAITSGIVVAWLENRYSRRAREAGYLKEQLQKLYGPLEYHATLIRTASDLFEKIRNAGHDLYGDSSEQWKDKPEAQTWRLAGGEYVLRLFENDAKMMDILAENYCYCDPEDMEVFNEFVSQCLRHKTEYGKDGQLKIDERLQKEIGNDIPFCHPEMIDRVRDKFTAKHKRLRELGG